MHFVLMRTWDCRKPIHVHGASGFERLLEVVMLRTSLDVANEPDMAYFLVG